MGILTVTVKDGCLIEAPANLLLFTVHDLLNAFQLRRLAESGGPARVLFKTVREPSRLRSRCGAVHGDHLSRHAQGKPRVLVVQSWTGAGDWSSSWSMHRFRGRQ